MSHTVPKNLAWAVALGAMLALGACGGSDSPSAQPVAQTIGFTAPAAQSVGVAPLSLSATSSSGLAVSFASTTSAVCTVTGTVARFVGAGSCSVTASQVGDATYAAATPVSVSFSVAAGAQTITFLSPGNQALGTAPAVLMATSSSGLQVILASATPAVCTVNGTTLTLVSAGTCTLTADQAGNANYLAAAAVTHSFEVATGLLSQTINFAALGNQTLGTAAPLLAANATSGLAVSFASTTPAVCTVNGSALTLLSAGTCTASASQAGNTVYAAAPSGLISFTVALAQQVISFTSPGNQTLGTAPPALAAASTSALPVSLASTTAGVCTVSGSTLTLVSVGTCSLDATQAGDATYGPATTVTRTFTIAAPVPAAQAINFTAPGNQTLGTAAPALVATASSGLAVSFTSNTASVCTVSGNTVTLVAAGTCSITASQAGNASFTAATPVTNSFTVAAAPLIAQSITFTSPGNQTLGTAPPALVATASSNLSVGFTSNTTSVCTVSGNTLSLIAVGTCSITASQAGNSTYSAATPVTNSFAVAAAPLIAQSITFTSPSSQTLGTAPAALSASASSGLVVSFASTTQGVCTASGTTLTLVAVGTCSITASQGGNSTYSAATPVTRSFTVAAAPLIAQTITFTPPGNQTLGTAPAPLAASASSGLVVSFSSATQSVCTVSGTTLTLVAVGTCTVTATQGGNGVFSAATPMSNSFTVLAAPLIAQSITFVSPGTQTLVLNTAPPETRSAVLVASASSGLAVTLASTTPACTVSGTTLLLQSAGTCSITATQVGDNTYAAAAPVSVSFVVAYELFFNGGFETAGLTTPANAWLAAASGYTRSSDAHSGSFSIQLSSVAFSAAVALQNSVDQGGRAPLVVGSSPTLTFWAKGYAGETGNVLFALRYLDSIGNILATSNNQFFQTRINQNSWTQISYSMPVAVPAGATAAFIEFSQAIGPIGFDPVSGHVFVGGTVLIDDLSLKVAP